MGILQEDFESLLINSCIDWASFQNSHFLITGVTGLVGSFVVKALRYANQMLNARIKISCLVRNKEKAVSIFGENEDISYIVSDVCEKFSVHTDIDYIIHCASVTASKIMVSYPVETLMTAVDGTRNILEIAREKHVKSMVYVSSMEVYGAVFDEERTTEDKLGYVQHKKRVS
jgi:nucleoside-diphosphate-sugar epimerase